MPCFSPLEGYRAKEPNPNGKRRIVFNPAHGYVDRPVKVPCGQCVGCKLERSRQWATRCVHEAQMHDANSFITLTYSDDHLPDDYSVSVRETQLFTKKLRKRMGRFRYFQCGEYGAELRRPHYHMLLFGMEFPDLSLYRQNAQGDCIYTSKLLEEIWGKGFCTVGQVTFQSAAYTARYVMKKRTGEAAQHHYQWVHPCTGEIVEQTPEFVTMSRRPGIGKAWLDRFRSDVYPGDFVVLNGKKVRPPKWYDTVLERDDPKLYRELKIRRKLAGLKHADNNTRARLRVRETVQLAKLENLKRNTL